MDLIRLEHIPHNHNKIRGEKHVCPHNSNNMNTSIIILKLDLNNNSRFSTISCAQCKHLSTTRVNPAHSKVFSLFFPTCLTSLPHKSPAYIDSSSNEAENLCTVFITKNMYVAFNSGEEEDESLSSGKCKNMLKYTIAYINMFSYF